MMRKLLQVILEMLIFLEYYMVPCAASLHQFLLGLQVYLHYRMPAMALGSMLQAFVQVAVVTAAFYVGLSRISDNKHHWTDVLGGFIIGFLFGIYSVSYQLFEWMALVSNSLREVHLIYFEISDC